LEKAQGMAMNGNNFLSVDELKILLLSAALAIFGGFAKLFMSSKKLTAYQFVACCLCDRSHKQHYVAPMVMWRSPNRPVIAGNEKGMSAT
jgi:hypothetical protein